MDFEIWMDRKAEWIATALAKCDDPRIVMDILKHINMLWKTQCEQRLGWQEDTGALAKKIKAVIDE